MSITITTTVGPISGYKITCGCLTTTPPKFDNRDDAVTEMVALRDHLQSIQGCTDGDFCSMYLMVDIVEEDPAPYLNMSNTNARMVLGLLGFSGEDFDYSGTMTAEDFSRRVEEAAMLADAEPEVPVTLLQGAEVLVVTRALATAGATDPLDHAMQHGWSAAKEP